MRTAPHSRSNLAARLGLRDGMRAAAFGAPPGPLERVRAETPGARIESKPLAGVFRTQSFPFLWCFCDTDAELKRMLPALCRALEKDGQLWISWPQPDSPAARRLESQALTAEEIRGRARELGLDEVSAGPLDDTWSGMKLVARQSAAAEA